jgi:hypothetical protein
MNLEHDILLTDIRGTPPAYSSKAFCRGEATQARPATVHQNLR